MVNTFFVRNGLIYKYIMVIAPSLVTGSRIEVHDISIARYNERYILIDRAVLNKKVTYHFAGNHANF